MLIYILLIIFIILFGIIINPNKAKKNKKIYLVIVFLLLIIIGAIRNSTVGVDTKQYTSSYEIIRYMDFADYNSLRFEIGFFWLCKILNYITYNSQILISITSIIIFALVGFFVYKNSKDVILSSILFVTLNYYGMCMSAMRQALAIAIIMFVFKYLLEHKYIKYIIGIIIASLFHQTALIMICLIPFTRLKFRKNYMFIVCFVAVFAFVFSNVIFGAITNIFKVYNEYSESGFFESNYFAALINVCVSFVILVFGFFCNYVKNGRFNDENNLLAYIMCISFILYVITMKISIFSRATMYFSIFSTIWIPNSIMQIEDSKQRILAKYIVFISSIFYWGIIAIYRPEWHGVIPYEIFF